VYHRVTREGRRLSSASVHTSLKIPGLAGRRGD
jgi:hypothetical protein